MGSSLSDANTAGAAGGGYEEYDHGLGHQVSITAHDGSGLLAPAWERSGGRSHELVEAGQVYTLEPRLPIADHGIATLEAIVVVEEAGVRWLSTPQTERYLVGKYGRSIPASSQDGNVELCFFRYEKRISVMTG